MDMTRKGSCINFGNCSKADLKETIEIGVTEDFLCPECDSELTEVAGKSKGGKKKPLIIGGAVLALLLAGGGLIFALSGDESEDIDYAALAEVEQLQPVAEEPEATVVETPAPAPATPEPEAKPAPKSNSGLELGYATYKGDLKDGKANGMGTMYYNERHLISARDRQERYAEAGDYIVGEFYDGELVQGKLFGEDNVQKQTLILGRPH